ncbi:hypothetical protein B0H14DRAFT_2575275 [Mycena olivaceomarginata]|nr:hypothetical protein B0H14DRAFT_2575275 [Mycena olivaceomarginata]
MLAFLIHISTLTGASVRDVGVYNIHPRFGRAISAHLAGLGNLYFTVGSRRVSWDDTMESLKLGPISHLDLRIRVPGGANPDPEASSSSLPTKRKRDEKRMQNILTAEDLDSDGNPEGDQPKKSARKPRKKKARRDDTTQSDAEA